MVIFHSYVKLPEGKHGEKKAIKHGDKMTCCFAHGEFGEL